MIGVVVCFLHYSRVWVVVEGVDVVADNAAGLSVSLRTGRCALLVLTWRRCWRRHRKVSCVVPDNIDAGVGWYHDRHVGRKPKGRQQNQPNRKARSIMISVLGQQLWKNKLVAGVLTIVLGAMVLAWPGPTILVVATMFGVYLLVSGFAELFLAFTLPRSAATRVLLFLTGALSVVLAIMSFRHFGDGYAVLLLTLWLGIGFIFLGVSENAVAISERNLPGRGWYVVFGVMSLIAGAVVLVWPFDSLVVLTLVSGVSLVILGVIQIVQAIQIRKDTKTARDTVEALSEQVPA
jgi:uncharacterized membrane protein HdeD (DUF308 family)